LFNAAGLAAKAAYITPVLMPPQKKFSQHAVTVNCGTLALIYGNRKKISRRKTATDIGEAGVCRIAIQSKVPFF